MALDPDALEPLVVGLAGILQLLQAHGAIVSGDVDDLDGAVGHRDLDVLQVDRLRDVGLVHPAFLPLGVLLGVDLNDRLETEHGEHDLQVDASGGHVPHHGTRARAGQRRSGVR
jgi:hypothetical protein